MASTFAWPYPYNGSPVLAKALFSSTKWIICVVIVIWKGKGNEGSRNEKSCPEGGGVIKMNRLREGKGIGSFSLRRGVLERRPHTQMPKSWLGALSRACAPWAVGIRPRSAAGACLPAEEGMLLYIMSHGGWLSTGSPRCTCVFIYVGTWVFFAFLCFCSVLVHAHKIVRVCVC